MTSVVLPLVGLDGFSVADVGTFVIDDGTLVSDDGTLVIDDGTFVSTAIRLLGYADLAEPSQGETSSAAWPR